jgi:hypothetical protein
VLVGARSGRVPNGTLGPERRRSLRSVFLAQALENRRWPDGSCERIVGRVYIFDATLEEQQAAREAVP